MYIVVMSCSLFSILVLEICDVKVLALKTSDVRKMQTYRKLNKAVQNELDRWIEWNINEENVFEKDVF